MLFEDDEEHASFLLDTFSYVEVGGHGIDLVRQDDIIRSGPQHDRESPPGSPFL